jgi:hypothetical protein
MDNHVYILDSFAIGKKAEDMAAKRIKKAGWHVTDVRKNPIYQVKDIDYICSGFGSIWTVDVKTDRCHYTGNYFFEIISNVETNKAGWGYTSEANYILIVYPTSAGHELHVLDMAKIREWLIKNADKCKVIENTTKREDGSIYYSQGIIVNRQKFARESGAVMQILPIEKNEQDVA